VKLHTVKQGEDDTLCDCGPCDDCFKNRDCQEWLDKRIMKTESIIDELKEREI
jgi:hypothetical protein